ncbi:hypothetical protein SAMN05216267_102834 [Actinacidiphila rubida]|uniref:Lipoprotein n=1 Tax=Actinacidiphila rubida TaxID=310780 RepID=A0A1H8Q4E9_9ACTN|nr:hypothetical protein [Actinacidiphila rubida]SEO49090.1 hypothetical protein SAMN05216267_102834 [Actinacidiphila rubida]
MAQPPRHRRALAPVCLAAAAAAAALAGCGSSGGDSPGKGGPGPTPAATSPASPAPVTAPAAPAPGRDTPVPSRHTPTPTATPTVFGTTPPAAADELSACYGGACTLTVTHPVTVPLDASRFGFASFRVTALTAGSVTVAADDGGNHLRSTGSAGSYLTLNNLAVHVLSATAGSARLTFAATGR